MNDKKQEDTSKKMKLIIDGLNLMAVSTVFEWKLMQSGGEFSLICKFCYPVPSSFKNGIAIGWLLLIKALMLWLVWKSFSSYFFFPFDREVLSKRELHKFVIELRKNAMRCKLMVHNIMEEILSTLAFIVLSLLNIMYL